MARFSHGVASVKMGPAGVGLLVFALVGALGAGCAMQPAAGEVGNATAGSPAPASIAAQPSNPFAPPLPPNGFDPERAFLTLSQVPDAPPPIEAAPADEPELPRQAIRHMEEARRLFAEERYSETVVQAGKALRYNQDIVEAHRLAALASLLLGKIAEAQTHADAAIAVRPDDLACRYVRGRLAEKAQEPKAALFEYRIALNCPAPDQSDELRTLVHHQLGLLLNEMGYYRAAADQLKAFEAAAQKIVEPKHPELASILRTKRTVPLLALAEAQEALSEFGPAADTLLAVLDHTPDDHAIRVRYIKDLVRAHRFDDAQAEATRHAAARRDLASAELLVAVYRAGGQPDLAIPALQKLAADNPDNTELALFHADTLIAAKQFDRAAAALNDLIAQGKDPAAARWKLIALHRARGDYQGWIRAMGAQLAADPADAPRGLSELARIGPDEAKSIIDQALSRRAPVATQPDDSDAAALAGYYYSLGWLAAKLNRPADAQTLYANALEVRPDFTLAAIGTAELYIEQCAWEKALAVLENMNAEATASEATVARLTGRCYDGLDKLTEAARHYRQSIDKDNNLASMLLLGRLYQRFQQFNEAAQTFEQAVRAYPDSMEARELLILARLSRWSEDDNLKNLLAELKEMQKIAPEHPATTRTTALVRLLMRQPPDLETYVGVLANLVEARPEDQTSRRSLAAGLIRMSHYDEAVNHLTELLKQNPCDSEGNELLALAFMRQLKIEEAAEHLARTLERYPNREPLLRNLGEVRLVQQDYPAAMELWQRLLALESNTERHAAYRGRVISSCLQAGWYDRIRQFAEEWLRDAEEDEIAVIRSYLLLAEAAQQNHAAYLEHCRKWQAENPKDPHVRQWLLGIGPLAGQTTSGLIGAGRADEAIALATAWAAGAPGDPVTQHLLLQTLRATRRYDDIIEICKANLALAEKPAEYLAPLQILADALLRAERYDEAIAAVKEMATQAGQLTEADLGFQMDELMISFLAQAKRYDDAIVLANRMISTLNDKDARLSQLIAENADDAALRVQVLKAQEKIREQRADVLRSLSFVHVRQDRRDQAIECLRQAIELTPTDAGLNNDLGYMLADAGMHLDEAERMLVTAVSEVLWNGVGEDNRQAAFMDSLGWLYYKRGNFERAHRWLALGAKMKDGQDPVIYDHLGDVEWRLGHRDEAVRCWNRSLELHDRKVKEEHEHPDEKLVASVKAKLEQAEAGGKPVVATATAD